MTSTDDQVSGPRRSITPKPETIMPLPRETVERAYRSALGSYERDPVGRDDVDEEEERRS